MVVLKYLQVTMKPSAVESIHVQMVVYALAMSQDHAIVKQVLLVVFVKVCKANNIIGT